MTDDELRAWAEPRAIDGLDYSGDAIAAAVLRLLDEKAALQAQVEGHVERIAAQSELLSRKAEVNPGAVCTEPDNAMFSQPQKRSEAGND